MKIIAILGQKGGTGKTTLAVALAVSAVQDGKTTVAIDLDPQASLCEWSDIRQLDTPIVVDCQPPRLPKAIAAARKGNADICIIDTAGRAEVAALSAAKQADLIIIPTQPTVPDMSRIAAAIDIVTLAGNKTPMLVVITRVKSRSRYNEAAKWLSTQDIHVCPHSICERVAWQDSYGLGRAPQEQSPRSKAALECMQVYRYTILQLYNPAFPH